MTTTVKPIEVEHSEVSMKSITKAPAYGSLADLQRPRKRVEAEIEGKIYCFQELSQGEIEDITLATRTEEADGKEKTDYRGNQARWIAHSWINPDGTRVMQNPMQEYVVINSLPRDLVVAMYKPVEKMLGLSQAARDAMGKESGENQESTGGAS